MIKTRSNVEVSIGGWVMLAISLFLTSTLQAAQVGINWQWANPKPQGNPYNAIAYNSAGATSIAVGDLGGIVASSDAGLTWTAQVSGTTQRLNAVWEFSLGFVAVGDQGTILSSFLPSSWGPVASGTTARLNDIVRNGTTSGSLFVIVGDNGTILSSTDGLNWSAQMPPSGAGNLMSVAWSPGLGLFAAVSDSGKILASVDGVSWTFEFFTLPVNGFTAPSGFRAVTWDSTNNQFVAVGVSGIVETSTDGANWIQQTSPTAVTLTGIAQQGATLVAVGKFGSIETSTNGGTSWTEQLSGTDLQGVASDGSQFIAAGRGGRILGSSDGVTWSRQQPTTTLTGSRVHDVAWNGVQFLAVGDILDGGGNPSTLSSADGINWNLNGGNVDAPTRAVVWDGAQFVGVEGNTVLTSPDGISWTGHVLAVGVSLFDIAWDGAQFTAVGINGDIFTSPDAVTWTARTSGTANTLNAASGNGSIILAVGDNGTLLRSSDGGANWSAPSVPALGTSSLFDVIWNGVQFVSQTILPSSPGGLLNEKLEQLYDNDEPVNFEYDLNIADHELHFEARLVRLDDSDELVAIVRDITPQHRVHEALLESEERLRDAQAGLERRVEERTAELKVANQELETFGYTVSHDLRAPLRAISGFSETLMEEYGDTLDAPANDYIKRILNGCRRMTEMIEGLLKLSRSSRRLLERTQIDLSSLAAEVVEELRVNDPAHQPTVNIQTGITAYGDVHLLESVLENLLGNAWKYTVGGTQPRISFFSKHQGDGWIYYVEDNGSGFDMAYAKQLFTPFQRLHSQEAYPGIGIGLATVQRIIHRHGGEIRAHSAPGEGACFCFTLRPGIFETEIPAPSHPPAS